MGQHLSGLTLRIKTPCTQVRDPISVWQVWPEITLNWIELNWIGLIDNSDVSYCYRGAGPNYLYQQRYYPQVDSCHSRPIIPGWYSTSRSIYIDDFFFECSKDGAILNILPAMTWSLLHCQSTSRLSSSRFVKGAPAKYSCNCSKLRTWTSRHSKAEPLITTSQTFNIGQSQYLARYDLVISPTQLRCNVRIYE